MAKHSILTNKKILWGSAGVLLTSGVVIGVLVPVLTSKDDPKEKDTKLTLSKEVLNAKTSDDTITAMQKLYGLEIKKASAINDLESGELKSKYQSASNLATFIFANKNSYQTLFVQGNEQTTNLQEVVLIMSPKNQVREQNTTGNWPGNQVNAQDQFNFLITFFKGKVVKVRKLNAKSAVTNAAKIIFKTKAYDLINLFYQFKNADPQASNFGYYNAYLDDENSTHGLALFKKYLLTLKVENSTVTASDLTEVQFTKKSNSTATKTAVAELRFSYQGLSTIKTISDFQYKVAYKLTLKAGVENKMADEVQIADIDVSKLPPEVTIIGVKPSAENADGSVIKITFNGSKIASQELAGLTSYQVKAQTLLENAQDIDFTITGQRENLPSTYNDGSTLRNQLKAKANTITNNNAKTKVQEILETATITFVANDQTGALSFTIAIGKFNKTFTSDLDTFNSINKVNTKIDLEVARKTMPTIKSGSEVKRGSEVVSEWKLGINKKNIIITPNDHNLISKILNIKVKEDLAEELSESILVVTIEVSSSIDGTKVKNYEVDLAGFVDNITGINFWNLVSKTGTLSPIKDNDFINLGNISKLPSQIKDIDLIRSIKNIFQSKLNNKNTLQVFAYKDKKHIDRLKKLVNNNMKITFVRNDQKGTIQFTTKLGSFQQTFTITGFKTSTSS